MAVYRVTWRSARSEYATHRTLLVDTPDTASIPAALVGEGHATYEADVHLVKVLRRFVVKHEPYAQSAYVRALASAQLAPWERHAYVMNDGNRWGDTTSIRYAEEVFPSTDYCTLCDVNAARGPWALGITTRDGRSITYTRNIQSHADAHAIGEGLESTGALNHVVYPDTCG